MLPFPNPAVLFQQLDDGAVLFVPSSEIYFGLNEVGTRIWALLPPASESIDELCGKLLADYPDVPREVIGEDVAELLESLVREGLALPEAPVSARDGTAP